MSFTSSSLGFVDVTFGLFGRIFGMFGRLVGRLFAIVCIGVLCFVSYLAYTLRLDLWHQESTTLLTPLFVFLVVFASSSVLIIREKSRFASGILIGAMAYITLNIVLSFFTHRMPKMAEGLKIRAEQFDQSQLLNAKAEAVEVKTSIPCPERGYFGKDRLIDQRVSLIGYTRDISRNVRCFDIRLNPAHPGVDSESGQDILPITPDIVDELRQSRIVAATPEPTQVPEVVKVVQTPIATAEPIARPVPIATKEPPLTFRVFIKKTTVTLDRNIKITGEVASDIVDQQGSVLIKRGKKLDLDTVKLKGVPSTVYLAQFRITDKRLPNTATSEGVVPAVPLYRLGSIGDDEKIRFAEQFITFTIAP